MSCIIFSVYSFVFVIVGFLSFFSFFFFTYFFPLLNCVAQAMSSCAFQFFLLSHCGGGEGRGLCVVFSFLLG